MNGSGRCTCAGAPRCLHQVQEILAEHVSAAMAVLKDAGVHDDAAALGYIGDAMDMALVDVPRDGHCGAHVAHWFRMIRDDKVTLAWVRQGV